jgi:hypothetical protein
MSSSNELREWLDSELEYSIPTKQWDNFRRDVPEAFGEYEADLENGYDVDAARRSFYLSWNGWSKKGKGPRETVVPDDDPDPRWDALAEILVFRARQDPDVIDFRRDALGDKLIDPANVAEWIKATAETDGQPTAWVTVPEHDDHTWPTSRDEAIALGSYATSRELVEYTTGDGWKHYQPVRLRGRLWHLRTVARRLVQGSGWPEAWTTTFILADQPPPRPMIFGYTIHHSSTTVPAMDQIELRVNPYAVGPRQLETVYRKIRSDELDISRVDAVSDKTAALAVLWEKTEGQTTSDRRGEWNRLHPEWKYPEPTGNFGRDARAAHRQVTGEGKST